MSAENPQPNNFERQPDTYRLSLEEIKRNSAAEASGSSPQQETPDTVEKRQPEIHRPSPVEMKHEYLRRYFAQGIEASGSPPQQETPDTVEKLEDQPDYIEKLEWVPLPLDTMRDLLNQVTSAQQEGDGQSQEASFKRHFTDAMLGTLNKLSETAKPGDNITFEDLAFEAMKLTGHIDKLNLEFILKDPSFGTETSAMEEVTNTFARFFDQRPDLEQVGDNVDSYTVHPDVHTYQKDRIKANPEKDFIGYEHGENGRWIPEERGDIIVWVAKEQKQQEEYDQQLATAPRAINQAEVKVPPPPTETLADRAKNPQAEDDDTKLLDQVPDSERERIPFAKQNFAEISVDKIPLMIAYLQKELKDKAARVPEGSRYPDTIAAFVGNGGEAWNFLRAMVSAKRGGKVMEPDDFSRLPFSEVANSLGIDVKKLVPDYEQRFRMR